LSTNRELDRIPPFNLEAERSVLGSSLIDRESLLTVMKAFGPMTSMIPDTGQPLR
jgi:hypothetical protein